METPIKFDSDTGMSNGIILQGTGDNLVMCNTFQLKQEIAEDDKSSKLCDQFNNANRTDSSLNLKKRGKYQRISDETKRRIVAAFEAEENILIVAQEQGIKPRTAYTIVRRAMRGDWPPKNPRGGARHLKVDDEVRACLAGILESNPQATQEAIRLELEHQLPKKPKIALSTLSTAMDGLLYEVFTSNPVNYPLCEHPDGPVTDDLAESRYTDWFMKHGRHQKLIYIDERSYNVWTRRFQGKKESNSTRKMFHVIGRQRGKNLSVLLAMGSDGLLIMEIFQGDANEDMFAHILAKLADKTKDTPCIMLTEHTSVHRIHATNASSSKLAYYPFGCSYLNPLSYAFSALKTEVRQRLNIRRADLFDHDAADKLGVTLHQLRLRLLETELRAASNTIFNANSSLHWFRIMSTCVEIRAQRNQEASIKQEVKEELSEELI